MDRPDPDKPEPPPAIALAGHSVNAVGLPTSLLASSEFNHAPVPLHIAGAREMNRQLFAMLEEPGGPEDWALAFETYMAASFGLDPEMRAKPDIHGRRQYRSSYFRLLRGWGFDSNGREAAVFKGWVESRFGLYPTFHKQPLGAYPSDAWMTYLEEKMGSRFHNNAIHGQLDLLYEFCQWALARLHHAEERHLTVYRGVNDFKEHPMLRKTGKRTAVLRLNNLASFTTDRAVASCFGDTILEARVPLAKIVFFNELLPKHALKGEGEILALGGDYDVVASYY